MTESWQERQRARAKTTQRSSSTAAEESDSADDAEMSDATGAGAAHRCKEYRFKKVQEDGSLDPGTHMPCF